MIKRSRVINTPPWAMAPLAFVHRWTDDKTQLPTKKNLAFEETTTYELRLMFQSSFIFSFSHSKHTWIQLSQPAKRVSYLKLSNQNLLVGPSNKRIDELFDDDQLNDVERHMRQILSFICDTVAMEAINQRQLGGPILKINYC